MVSSALKVMKPEQTPEPSSVIEEMVRASGSNTEARITTFANAMVHKKCIPYDYQQMITYIRTE